MLQLILSRQWLYASGMKHEVFRLLASAYPAATAESREALIRACEVGPAVDAGLPDADYHRRYAVFNLAAWLVKHAPDLPEASALLTRCRQSDPDFQPREHLDLDHWSGGVRTIVPRSPMTPDALLAADFAQSDTMRLLLTFNPPRDRSDDVDRTGLLAAVRDAVIKEPYWGERLARALADEGSWASDLWVQIVIGWRFAERSAEDALHLIAFIRDLPAIDAVAGDALLELLETVLEQSKEALTPELVESIETIVDRLYATGDGPSAVLSLARGDWVVKAMNQRGGKAADVLAQCLSWRQRRAGEHWLGMPADYATRLQNICSGAGHNAASARIMLARSLSFLYAVDSAWTTEYFLPLFDIEREQLTAEQMWHGFAHGSSWNDPLFVKLRPYLERAYPLMNTGALEEIRDELTQFLASVAAYSVVDPWHDGWLLRFAREAGEKSRREWTAHLGRILEQAPADVRRSLWSTWARDYWNQRLNGVPLPLSPTETEELVLWMFAFPEDIEELSRMIVRTPAPAIPDDQLFFRLQDSETLMEQFSGAALSRVLGHLLAGAQSLQWSCDDIDTIMRFILLRGAPGNVLRAICGDMARLGCSQASTLLSHIDEVSPN